MIALRFGGRWKEAMTDLLLGDREQAAVRAIIASEPLPGADLPGQSVLPHLARFIECDAIGVALIDGTGSTVGEAAVGRAPCRRGRPHARRPGAAGRPALASRPAPRRFGVRTG